MISDATTVRIGRRAFLQNGTLTLLAANLDLRAVFAEEEPSEDELTIGLLTDMHYADKPSAGTRHYRETLTKLREAAAEFKRQQPDFVVELGDLIDRADTVELEQQYLERINRELAQTSAERHYVLGNHCVDTLTKKEFLAGVGQASSYYSFDRGGLHFVVLDACFRSDGEPYGRKNFEWTDTNLPAEELDWLSDDLRATDKPTIVFVHQRLDVRNNHGVKNNAEVRKRLEASGRVQVVFQGHSHQNDLKELGGIHYCTLAAMVEGSGIESNSYSIMKAKSNGSIELTGFRRQASRQWKL